MSHEPPDDDFVGAIDNGTTSSRFLIFDKHGSPVASHQVEFEQIYPEPGWHEHDPAELITSVEECIYHACHEFQSKGYRLSQIKGVGITNQRETTIVWDSRTGTPLHNAIVWTDTRTRSLVQELKSRKGACQIQELCGLPLSTYPSSTKLLWLLRHNAKVKQAYDEGNLAFGTVDTWLIYNLNGGPARNVFVTDTTNASRTMWMNIHTRNYDDSLLSFFQLDGQRSPHLPTIVPSSDPDAFGSLAYGGPLEGIKITGVLGDQSSALVGQCGFFPGRAKNTYGTGCFLLCNVGEKPVISAHGLLATVAYDFGRHDLPATYALEGSIAVAGSSVKFLANNLNFFQSSSEISALASSVSDNGGCVFVTAFSGLFAPYWIDDARGTIFGLSGHTQRGHIARATLEATCFQTKAILQAMERDSGHLLHELAVDGGMSNSDLCMQIQSDLIQIPIDRPSMRETTALGAAVAAGLSPNVRIWSDLDQVRSAILGEQEQEHRERHGGHQDSKNRDTFKPSISARAAEKMYGRWNKAVEMCRGWCGGEDDNDNDSDNENVDDDGSGRDKRRGVEKLEKTGEGRVRSDTESEEGIKRRKVAE